MRAQVAQESVHYLHRLVCLLVYLLELGWIHVALVKRDVGAGLDLKSRTARIVEEPGAYGLSAETSP